MNDDDKFKVTWTDKDGGDHIRVVLRSDLPRVYRWIASQGGKLGGVVKQR